MYNPHGDFPLELLEEKNKKKKLEKSLEDFIDNTIYADIGETITVSCNGQMIQIKATKELMIEKTKLKKLLHKKFIFDE
jgi:hypothetical protein